MPDKNLKEIEDEHSNVDSPIPVDDPDLHTNASPRTPDNVRTETAVTPERTPHTSAEAVNPLSYLPVDDPDIPTPASPRTPDNIPPERTTHTSIEAINPLPKSSVECKQSKRKSQKSEILSGTPYRKFADSKEKARKMKGKSERQQKRLEAAQEKEKKPGGLK
jgi:hypothetical protein